MYLWLFDIKDLFILIVEYGFGFFSRFFLVFVVLFVLIIFIFFCMINLLIVIIGNVGIFVK